jgi:hypothetical protein
MLSKYDEFLMYPSLVVKKAEAMIQRRDIFELQRDVFTADGTTGSHIIRVSPNGKITCSCEGYRKRGICSHAVAIAMLIESRI